MAQMPQSNQKLHDDVEHLFNKLAGIGFFARSLVRIELARQ